MTPSIEKMANLPDGATLIHPDGAVCGYSLVEKDVHLYFLPGVPDQMRYLMDTFVLPDILSLCDSVPVVKHRVLKIYGLNEPIIAEKLKGLERETERLFWVSIPISPKTTSPSRCMEKTQSAVSETLEQDRNRDHGQFWGIMSSRRETGKWRMSSRKNSGTRG